MTITLFPAQQFGHHQGYVSTFGDAVAMATVGAGNVIIPTKVGAHPGGYRLFPDVKVEQPGNNLPRFQLHRLFLEPADQKHGSVQLDHKFMIQAHLSVLLAITQNLPPLIPFIRTGQ
jgi:hypothetical protein